ncbi:hypothetical protein BCR43DRAFT_371244 [Syncephalastrum racemosum]|uniref:Uncharacterized protein n=1 Tax=Syncephalastrum racemosum TaxID=13706 RepID=A0A1X2H4C7_SYNRA|nr:hypothetical protein BCR43DRAFT_371244 [Syncephalastrum racemosum]
MLWGFSKRTAILAVLSIIALSILLTFSISTVHFRSGNLQSNLHQKGPFNLASLGDCLPDTAQPLDLTREQWDQCLEPGEDPAYYLSIVTVTRMDDYAGNQYHRLQNHIDSAYLLAEHTREKIELLIIEWNPPSDKRTVIDTFRFRRSEFLTYRIITVPENIHNELPNHGNAPLHEFEGKNVGIRFARGEFVACTNQDDIWSHNFHNAVKSRAFQKGVIYLQHQDRHNIHDNLPKTIVNLPAFPDDDMLYNACKLDDQDWGNYQLPGPTNVTDHGTLLRLGDQAGDYTMAHRDTWKFVKGYRESGGVAWVDIEFIGTAAWTFDMPIVYSEQAFTCHQEHENVWESKPERMTPNHDIDMGAVMRKEKQYVNPDHRWALLHLNIWQLGLRCVEFQGGLCW